MSLSIDSLLQLTTGALFRQNKDHVTAQIQSLGGGGFLFTASCDSLTFLVSDLKTEIFHLNADKTELKEHLNEQKIIEVNRPSGWQWFQIWLGRILSIWFGAGAVWGIIKRKLISH